MKTIKIILVILSIFFTTSVFAKTIDIVPTASLKGPHGVVVNAITELAKNSGMEFVAKEPASCGEAVDRFNNAKEPIAITWSDSMIRQTETTKQNCIIDFEKAKPIAVTFNSIEVCVPKGFELKPGTELTLGNNKFNPQISQLAHMNANNKNIKFKSVTYPGSGAVATALVNKEINVGIITGVASAASAIKAGSIDCLYSTGSNKYGQKPVSEFTGTKDAMNEFKVGNMVFVRNLSAEQIAKLEKSLVAGFDASLEKEDFVDNKVGINKDYFDRFIKIAKDYMNYR